MSKSHKRPIGKVLPIANALINKLEPHCQRIEIAGSLRRGKDMVGDIEILAIPMPQENLFGESSILYNPLDHALNYVLRTGKIRHSGRRRWGTRLKSFCFKSTSGSEYHVDLFIQTPETWGVNMMIRTGSAAFSKNMVTHRAKGGRLPNNMYFSGGRLYADGQVLDTPEEIDVFHKCGMNWVPPKDR